MSPWTPIFLSLFVLAVRCQQITFVQPIILTQCAQYNIQWNGGVAPYQFVLATTDDSPSSSVSITPAIRTNSIQDVMDLAGGNKVTLTVTDNNDVQGQAGPITVSPSSNTSCLDNDGPSPSSSSSSRSHSSPLRSSASSAQTGAGVSPSTAGASNTSTNSSSHVGVIVGAIAAALAFLIILVILLSVIKRRRARSRLTSKDQLQMTFGRDADLDSTPYEEEDIGTLPEPYILPVTSDSRTRITIDTDTSHVRRNNSSVSNPSTMRNNPPQSAREPVSATTTLPTPASATRPRKGEAVSYQTHSGLQDHDLDRLAVRMVALMAAGRQGYSPDYESPRSAGVRDAGRGEEDAFSNAPPPMYSDTMRRR